MLNIAVCEKMLEKISGQKSGATNDLERQISKKKHFHSRPTPPAMMILIYSFD